MAESEFLYKIISLQLLSMSAQPLTRTQMTDFFLEKGYADYFTIRPILYDLEETGMILPKVPGSEADAPAFASEDRPADAPGTVFVLAPEGERTLAAYRDRITKGIRSDLEDYLRTHAVELHLARDIKATYDKASDGGYIVSCKASEEGRKILTLELRVPDAAQAEAICYNWKVRYSDAYAAVLDSLLG